MVVYKSLIVLGRYSHPHSSSFFTMTDVTDDITLTDLPADMLRMIADMHNEIRKEAATTRHITEQDKDRLFDWRIQLIRLQIRHGSHVDPSPSSRRKLNICLDRYDKHLARCKILDEEDIEWRRVIDRLVLFNT